MEPGNPLEVDGTVVTVTLLAVVLALLYWYSISPFSQLERLGIRHPKPTPFLGNLLFFQQGFWEGDQALVKAYGPICGYYMGRRMMIVVSEPDAIKQILQEDFHNFQNRMRSSLLPKLMCDSLLFLRDERWQQVRGSLLPAFSSVRLSEMCPLINQACNVLEKKLESYADSGETCDIHRYYSGLTMDIVSSLVFSTVVDSEENPDEPLIKHVKMFLDLFTPVKPILILAMAFPHVMNFFLRLFPNKKQKQVNGFFCNLMRDLVAARDCQAETERRSDFLQLVLNNRRASSKIQVEHFDIVNKEDLPSPLEKDSKEKSPKTMSEDEILGQAVVFIVAGYETTRSLLSFTTYLLATNPECQEKLLREIDALTDRQALPDDAMVKRLPYLDMVISEALRMYPPAFRFAREASKDCTVAGQHIPAGAVVEIPVGYIQNNPQYWPAPEKFDPERFTAEAKQKRHPFVYLPFGAGPRCCVGVRLALLQTKIALVRVLQKYRFETCPQTQIPLQLNTLAIVGPKDGIHIRIVPR
ncbi:thromboxane-A synthase [Ambystoma mexicanum]|uniref:thromboxane-A synthase n=1 Tax=Ambystoma mexicanum TaxID=8296 RepID=UPI0037E7A4C2